MGVHARQRNPFKVGNLPFRRFDGIGGPQDQILERRDRQGNDISTTLVNEVKDLDHMEDGSLILRDGYVKQQETGFTSSVTNLFPITLGGRLHYGYVTNGGFNVFTLNPLLYNPNGFDPFDLELPPRDLENITLNVEPDTESLPDFNYPALPPAFDGSNPENGTSPQFSTSSGLENERTNYHSYYLLAFPLPFVTAANVMAFHGGAGTGTNIQNTTTIRVLGGTDTVAPSLSIDKAWTGCGGGASGTHYQTNILTIVAVSDWLSYAIGSASYQGYSEAFGKNQWNYTVTWTCDGSYNSGGNPTGAKYYFARWNATATYGVDSADYQTSCDYP